MVTTIVPPTLDAGGTITYAPAPQGMVYKYDRLNRLKSSKAWQDIDAVGNLWATGDGSSYAGMYENNFSYDANGNITAQMRKDATGTAINDLTYNRRNVGGKTVQNRLYHVNDAVSNTAFTDDIDDQDPFINNELVNSVNNYGYDEIGNLNRNNQKEIAEMVYNVTGKVKEVHRTVGSNKENLKFDYDANGNRIAKHVYTSDDVWMKSDYYVNDAQGNNMAIYTLTASSGSGLSYQLAERDIYGSSRVGTNKTLVEMIGVTPPTNTNTHTLGDRNYFLENHLGNILAVVTDKKLPVDDGNGNVDYYLPHVISSQDYSAFGVLLEDRNFGSEKLRLGFQGQEKDDEVSGSGNSYTADNWQYSPRLGRRWNVDPLFKRYPSASPYSTFSNNPMVWTDPSGAGGETTVKTDAKGKTTAKVEANIYVYTDKDNVDIESFAKTLEASLNQQFNQKNEDGNTKTIKVNKPKTDENGNPTTRPGTVVNAEIEYIFKVIPVKGGPEAAVPKANSNKKIKNNYYLITSDSEKPNGEGNNHNYGGNSGVLNADANPKIWAHEISHNFGWVNDNNEFGSHEETEQNSIMFYPINENSKVFQYDINRLNGGKASFNKGGYGYGMENYIYNSKDKYKPINSNDVRPKVYPK